MKPTAVRNWHFDHKGKEYDVWAELLSENLHQPHVVVTVHEFKRQTGAARSGRDLLL